MEQLLGVKEIAEILLAEGLELREEIGFPPEKGEPSILQGQFYELCFIAELLGAAPSFSAFGELVEARYNEDNAAESEREGE
jgi:hypothetical protein